MMLAERVAANFALISKGQSWILNALSALSYYNLFMHIGFIKAYETSKFIAMRAQGSSVFQPVQTFQLSYNPNLHC